MLYTSH